MLHDFHVIFTYGEFRWPDLDLELCLDKHYTLLDTLPVI